MNFNGDIELVNADGFTTEEPLNTKFLLVFGNQEKPCPSFYGKVEDKKKGYRALKEDIHPEVHSNWAHFQCYWKLIPKIRLSKTAKYLNKVFLSCGASAAAGYRCKFFQWIHTQLYPLPCDPIPEWLRKGGYKPRPPKSFNKESQEWLQQAEQNENECKKQQAAKEWLNQFAESAKKQNEQREAKKKQSLPSTFHWSPEIAKMYKKQDQ